MTSCVSIIFRLFMSALVCPSEAVISNGLEPFLYIVYILFDMNATSLDAYVRHAKLHIDGETIADLFVAHGTKHT